MSSSKRLQLPYVQAAQAQKHLTVNEAFTRLDGTVNLTLESIQIGTAPGNPLDGVVYAVPAGATGEWAGHQGELAVASNGGWVYVWPSRGWRAWISDLDETAIHDGSDWVTGAVSLSPNGAHTKFGIVEIEHVITAGASNSVVAAIPQYTMVFGVTGLVVSDITGSLSGWRTGVTGSDNRYGSGLGLSAGSWLRGMTSGPLSYYSDTDLLLTAEAGDFGGGAIRLAVHYLELTPAAA